MQEKALYLDCGKKEKSFELISATVENMFKDSFNFFFYCTAIKEVQQFILYCCYGGINKKKRENKKKKPPENRLGKEEPLTSDFNCAMVSVVPLWASEPKKKERTKWKGTSYAVMREDRTKQLNQGGY